MDRLRQLASDVADAGLEARRVHDNETDACLAVVDEFCAEYEVVEALDVRRTKEPREHWLAMPDSAQHEPDFAWGDNEVVRPTTIIVPRKVPTLLEAMVGVSEAWHESHPTTPAMCDAMLALDAAIKKEQAR